MVAEIEQHRLGGDSVGDQVTGGLRDQDLPAVGRRADARSPVDI